MDDAHSQRGHGAPEPGKEHWLYRPRTVSGIFWGLALICVALGLADLFYRRHTIFAFEAIPGFFGIFGFVVCVGLVLGAKELRKILKRDENYYDR